MTDSAAQLQNLLRQQAATARFGSFALREPDLMEILSEAARVCAKGIDAPFGQVYRYRREHHDLLIVAGHGWHQRVIGQLASPADSTSPQGRAFITGKPAICADLRNDTRFEMPAAYAAHGIVSSVNVIIKGRDNEPFGILEIANNQPQDYDLYDINFLTGFANVLAEAVRTASGRSMLQLSVDHMKAIVEEKDRLLVEKADADRKLRQAQKMEAIGQLTGGVAHDLNNILTVIMGTSEILAETVAGRPDLEAVVKLIDEAAGRGADLTERLLAFARKQPLQPNDVDVNSLLIESAKRLRPTLGEQIAIELKLAGDLWQARVDPRQLNNAILILSQNARDAMPEGGELIIETANALGDGSMNSDIDAGAYVMVAVTDNGHGIAAHMLEHVFEPFFTTKEVDKGSGLGLSMVYGFVKQSNGHIKIVSEIGHGTTVRLYLPQAVGAAWSAEIADQPDLQGGNETILVVEDDPLVRKFVVGQIESLGYATLTAVDASAALIVIAGPQKIDLLFTDIIMPGSMNGRQLADLALQRRAALKVLFTSGYSQETIIHHGHLDAGVRLLAKPYRKSDLARQLRAALAA